MGLTSEGIVAQRIGSAGGRLSTITLDQVLSGGSNVAVAIVAAHLLSVSSFGLFTIVFLIYVTVQGVARAMVGAPLLVHPKEAQERPGDAIGAATLLGVLLGALVTVAGIGGMLLHASTGGSLVVLGVCLPLLGLQDLGRYWGFAVQRPWYSVVLDAVWLVLMIAALVLVVVTHRQSLFWFTAAWAGTGAIAGLIVPLSHMGTHLNFTWSWLRETWSYSWRYLASYVTTQGSTLLASIAFGVIAGPATLGAIRAAQLLQRPISALQAAGIAAGVSEIAHVDPPERSAIAVHVRRTAGLLVVAAILNGAVLIWLPHRLGVLALGDAWTAAKPLLLPASVQMMLLGLASGWQAALMGRKFVKLTLRLDFLTVAILVIPSPIAAAIGGAQGAYWTFAVGQGIVAVIWWLAYERCDLESDPMLSRSRSRGRHAAQRV